jgi:hypothetical protein
MKAFPLSVDDCHSYGNLAVDYSYPYQRKVWMQKTQPKVLGVELVETPIIQRRPEVTGNKRVSENPLVIPLESEE